METTAPNEAAERAVDEVIRHGHGVEAALARLPADLEPISKRRLRQYLTALRTRLIQFNESSAPPKTERTL